MKFSRKILACLLVIAMLANVGAVMSFAAEAPLAISLSAPTNVKAGDSFAVTVNFDSSDAAKEWSGGAIPLAYNSNYVSENDVASMAKLEGYAKSLDEGNFTTYEPMYGTELTAEEAATMNAIKVFGFTGTGVGTDVSAGVDCMTVTFTVGSDVADGTKIRIAVPTMAVDETVGELYFFDHANECEWYGNSNADMSGYQLNYDISAAYVDVTVGEAAPAEKEVKHADTMAQWADKAAGKINVGLVGKFLTEDIAIDYEGNKLTNVAKVGAKVTINGTEIEDYTEFVYDVNGDGSELWFRAVVTGVDYNATGAAGDISVVYVVEMTDGTTYESDAYTTTVAEVYAEACGNGMPAFGA